MALDLSLHLEYLLRDMELNIDLELEGVLASIACYRYCC
jgi:hypothetical protein